MQRHCALSASPIFGKAGRAQRLLHTVVDPHTGSRGCYPSYSSLVEDWSVEQVSASTAIERSSVGFESTGKCSVRNESYQKRC